MRKIRSLRLTKEGLDNEAHVKHRQALLEWLGLYSAAVQTKEIGQKEDETMLEVTERFSCDAKLHESGQVGRAIRREGDVHEDGESDTSELEEFEEGRQMSKRSGKSDVGDARTWKHTEMTVHVHVAWDWTKGPASRRARHSGETLVENAGFMCAEDFGSRILRCRHGRSWRCRKQSMMTDLGLSAQVRLWTDSQRSQRRLRAEEALGRPDMMN